MEVDVLCNYMQNITQSWIPTCISYFYGKSPHYLPQFSRKSIFSHWTPKLGKTPPSTFKIVHLTPWPCYKQFWRRFCLFLFYLFRLNLWKVIVNHRKIIKIENLILLDSTWVDLHSEHIIWYALVQSFTVSLDPCFSIIKWNNF